MHLWRRFHSDERGTEMVEFVVGATLVIAIMMLIMVGLWNTTHDRAAATDTIITDNVPTAAQREAGWMGGRNARPNRGFSPGRKWARDHRVRRTSDAGRGLTDAVARGLVQYDREQDQGDQQQPVVQPHIPLRGGPVRWVALGSP